ncbi:MAG: hypothetical protein SVM79_01705, partial [Chloroflexota bacterium]|nr:hypothetical protein [Chloroflexota bacterium]
MAPVIRIDDSVMNELKEKAVGLGLVFSTPNEVLRAILGLGNEEVVGESERVIVVQLSKIHTPRKWALIPIPHEKRRFFPGYKLNFALETDIGVLTTHVTSAPSGTTKGDPEGGKYVQGGLRP